MDKKTVGLIGAVAGLASRGSAHAGAVPVSNLSEAMHAASYADLLNPVPNAAALLKVDDAARAELQRVNGYVYFNYGAPPPNAYYRPYYVPEYPAHMAPTTTTTTTSIPSLLSSSSSSSSTTTTTTTMGGVDRAGGVKRDGIWNAARWRTGRIKRLRKIARLASARQRNGNNQ